MGRIYTCPFDAVAVTAAVDLFEVTVAADKPIRLHGLEMCQTTDLADAAEEVLRIGLWKGVTAGSGGTAVTPVPFGDDADTAAGATVNRTVTTPSTGGTLMYQIGWNIRIPGPVWLPIPEHRARFDAGIDPLVFRLGGAPADSITMGSTLIFEEI